MIDIIPAMDIMSGKCVRLRQGNFNEKINYPGDPVTIAQSFETAGIRHLHMVDLDGARQKQIVNWHTLQSVAKATALKIDFGGGVQSQHDCDLAFGCGAAQIVVGSLAVRHPQEVQLWMDEHGADSIILGLDVAGDQIAVSAWQEKASIAINDFLNLYIQAGIERVICTDISKDGMLEGPSLELYRRIKRDFPSLQLIASGGISKVSDIADLCKVPVKGVIIGKALYDGILAIEDLVRFSC